MNNELIQETLESMRDYVPKLVGASEKIALDIQSQQGGWLDTMLAYLEGLGWLTLAVSGIQRLDQALLKNLNIEALAPLLEQVKEALEQTDYVLLCDLLQYEMKPLLESFEEELRRVNH
ncbi:hypothetical protein G3578_10775 [Brevibacillus sp. SYP-B805]|uniref:hypothetical protein n=1 Tax=Brevibacillus sp. SYP-B805 TaxID=1578199 RepID=UPI0013EDFB56|nr:hypothetical protein [Brevibacillus sp. SYP-B805]NGQ95637.1 hypothetical protein [Brevibacillus sp. SYP-B805]